MRRKSPTIARDRSMAIPIAARIQHRPHFEFNRRRSRLGTSTRRVFKEPPRSDVIRGGVVAGLIAGSIWLVALTFINVTTGGDGWWAAKVAGLPWLGHAALRPGFEWGAVLMGVASHFAVSMVWGLLFGWLAAGLSREMTLGMGLLWGVIVWDAMFSLVLPLVGAERIRHMVPVSVAGGAHLLFGLAMAVGFLPFQPRGD